MFDPTEEYVEFVTNNKRKCHRIVKEVVSQFLENKAKKYDVEKAGKAVKCLEGAAGHRFSPLERFCVGMLFGYAESRKNMEEYFGKKLGY